MDKQYDWIIGMGGSDMDGVDMIRFHGTKSDVKKKLVELVKNDKKENSYLWDYGTTKLSDVTEITRMGGYEYYAFGCYANFHIDYTAIEFSHILEE